MFKSVLSRFILILSTILILSILWEFVVEDQILQMVQRDHEAEGFAERLEYVLTVFVFCAISLIIPFKMALKRQAEQKYEEQEREELIKRLRTALHEIKTLKGIIPICSHCRQIRDDEGAWKKIEEYVTSHTDAEFSHGICPECLRKEFPEEYEELIKDKKENS